MFVFLAAIAAVVGGGVIAVMAAPSRAQIFARQAARAPRAQIAGAPEQRLIRITGTILPGPTIRAPLTDRACVWFDAQLGIYVDHGGVVFVIEDGSGQAVIDPSRAQVEIEDARRGSFHADAIAEQPAGSRDWIARYAIAPDERGVYRGTERVLAIGDRVTVAGVAVAETDPSGARRAGGYRDLPPTRLVFTGELRITAAPAALSSRS